LAEAEITFVVVQFDGSGDLGVNEDIKYYATEDYGYEEREVRNANFSHLLEHFETLVLLRRLFSTDMRMAGEASCS